VARADLARLPLANAIGPRGELKFPKTKASMRAVPLQARALEALDRTRDCNGSPLVFPGERGGYLAIHHFRPFQWRAAQEAAGITPPRRGLRSPAHLRDFERRRSSPGR
jgi:hypothetical protein